MNLGRALQISGWMSDPELRFLASHAQDYKNIVEAGSFQGRSTRALADNTDGIVHAVDPWKPMVIFTGNSFNGVGVNTMTFTYFSLNMSDHLRSGKCVAYPMSFQDFNPDFVPDFCFIDAMHDYDNVMKDIAHAKSLMKNGGLLAGHDYQKNWPGVMKAVDKCFSNFQVTDTIWSVLL